MGVGLLKKPLFWIGIIVVVIIVLLILVLLPNSPKNIQSSPQKLSEKPRSGPEPGSCLVLEQKYCGNGKTAEWKNPNGTTIKLVAFRLPSGAPIFAPLSGTINKSDKGSSFISSKAAALVINDSKNPSATHFGIVGDLTFSENKATAEKGSVIAYAANNGVNVLGDYTLVLLFSKLDPEKKIEVVDKEMEQALFPYLK